VSPGCDHCYAATFAERWRGTPGHPYVNGFDLTLRPERLDRPLRWRRPSRVFVNSMSDLFHAAVPDRYIAEVFAVMHYARHHTFQVLTKRRGRLQALVGSGEFAQLVWDIAENMDPDGRLCRGGPPDLWPLPNVWLGVSVEDQHWADIRIPALQATPAAVRFVSAEPLLGPVDLGQAALHRLDWVIVGGESGPGARPMDPTWAADLVQSCGLAGVPVFVKQLGTVWAREHGGPVKGGDPHCWPADLRVRQFPPPMAAADGGAANEPLAAAEVPA
jgi:protein gp37